MPFPLLPSLKAYIDNCSGGHDVPAERRALLEPLVQYIRECLKSDKTARLIFICTHNSRRSHFGQAWAQAAAHHYGVGPVECYSGGTETTACNPRTVAALVRAGFRAQAITGGDNPVQLLQYAAGVPPLALFSKTFDQAPNPGAGYAAVMTCSQAEENCPYVPGADQRISLTYEDPKIADGTPEETATYDARCRQIATEMLYVFSRAVG